MHLTSLKASFQDLQLAASATENEIVNSIKSISKKQSHILEHNQKEIKPRGHTSYLSNTQWPAGSSPINTPNERKEAESNDGWIRLGLRRYF